MVKVFPVENTNSVLLRYNSNWGRTSWTNTSSDPPSKQPLAFSNALDAKVFLNFPSPGIGIAYYGMKRSDGGHYKICIDCDPTNPAASFIDIDALDRDEDGSHPPVLLYSNQNLTNDIHTVALVNTNDTRVYAEGRSQITLDRFEITFPDPPTSTVTSTYSTTSTPSTSTISLTETSTTSVSATSSATPSLPVKQSSSASVSTRLAVNVGAAIGGAVFALLIGLLLYWRHTRKVASDSTRQDGLAMNESLPGSRPIYPRTPYGNSQRLSETSAFLMSPTGIPAPEGNATVPPFNSGVISNEIRSSSATFPPSLVASPPPLVSPVLVTNHNVETDGGPVSEALPPNYTQVWDA